MTHDKRDATNATLQSAIRNGGASLPACSQTLRAAIGKTAYASLNKLLTIPFCRKLSEHRRHKSVRTATALRFVLADVAVFFSQPPAKARKIVEPIIAARAATTVGLKSAEGDFESFPCFAVRPRCRQGG